MKIKTTKITIGEHSLDVNAEQVRVMKLLGFEPCAIVGCNGFEGIKWVRIFGVTYKPCITVFYTASRRITQAEAVSRIVRAAFRQCEFDVMQRLNGPRLYSKLNS
jgi:hypothetical protein